MRGGRPDQTASICEWLPAPAAQHPCSGAPNRGLRAAIHPALQPLGDRSYHVVGARTEIPPSGKSRGATPPFLWRLGATPQEIMAATVWQKHTVHGFISTLPKRTGIEITSTRRESDPARGLRSREVSSQ